MCIFFDMTISAQYSRKEDVAMNLEMVEVKIEDIEMALLPLS